MCSENGCIYFYFFSPPPPKVMVVEMVVVLLFIMIARILYVNVFEIESHVFLKLYMLGMHTI